MFDWFFAPETSRVLLTTLLGSAAAIFSAIIASRNVSKTIRNQNKGLPPELLRLEKIQQIIINHNSDDILKNIDVIGFRGEYKKAIHRSILESKLGGLGIQDESARKKLLRIPEKVTDNSSFPDLNTIHGTKIDKFGRWYGIILAILGVVLVVSSVILLFFIVIYLLWQFMNGGGLMVETVVGSFLLAVALLILSLIFIFLGRSLINRQGILDIETDLTVRNVYQHYSEYFTGSNSVVRENEIEIKKRVIFENSKKYRKWLSSNPGKSSWDYGFSPEFPLCEQKIRGAIPVGFSVIEDQIVFDLHNFIFKLKGRKVVKSKSQKDLLENQVEYYI
ncbi:hypothetical protein [Rothia sp. P5766]|uniref:hypothetical protein n=1 Tax=Rothia sp. P5766 TaxID=3402656 RepID=UPI003AEE22AB